MAQAVLAPVPSRVQARRAEAMRAILDSAWRLSAESGLEALSLREIASSVGMRAPSLYSYFPSKAAILDAMFADGFRALDVAHAAAVGDLPAKVTPRRLLVTLLGAWIGFCQADEARYRLLFTRAVPGWQPSEAAYEASRLSFERVCGHLARAGVTDQDDVDLCTALSAGLMAQQMSNDPGGDRWARRLDDVVDMFLQHTASRDGRAARLREETP